MLPYLAAAALGYLFGCSNMAFYLGRLRGVDLRAGGSGNLGASNAMVLMGWRAGILTAVHDILKGTLAIWLVQALFPSVPYIGLVTGTAAVLGHNFPVFLRFRGGKGFATYFGMTLGVSWKIALVILVVGVILTLVTDYIVVATFTTVVGYPFYAAWAWGWVALLIVCAASMAVFYKHRENITRLLNGTEIGLRKAHSGKLRVKK